MKKISVLILLMLACILNMQAITPQDIISNVVSSYSKSKCVNATYSVKSNQANTTGSITMSGSKFRIISNDLKCWFDGKTMWSYLKATGELCITEPTSAELAMSNPYAAAVSFKNNYTPALVSNSASTYVVKLTAKKRNAEVSNVVLTVSKSYQIQKAVFTMRNKQVLTVGISNYSVNNKGCGNSTFVYQKNLLPKGITTVDLR